MPDRIKPPIHRPKGENKLNTFQAQKWLDLDLDSKGEKSQREIGGGQQEQILKTMVKVLYFSCYGNIRVFMQYR